MTLNRADFFIGKTRIVPSRNILVSSDGQHIALEPRIMDALCELAATPRQVVSRDHLITQIWQVQFGGDESLTRAISIIRKTFKKAGDKEKVIETIPKRGYRLMRDVKEAGSPLIPSIAKDLDSVPDNKIVATELAVSGPSEKTTHDISPNYSASDQVSASAPTQMSRRNSELAFKILVPLFILTFAVASGWWMGRQTNTETENSGTDIIETPPAELQILSQEPNQAELATAILFSFLDGQMTREDAIKGATPHLQLAERTMPSDPATLVAKGWMHFMSGENESAHIAFERAKTINFQLEDAWIGKAYLAAEDDNLELALFNLDQALGLNPLSFRARGKKAELYMALGQIPDAYSELESILDYSPNNYLANMLMEKIRLFEYYDSDNNLIISPGEISEGDEQLIQLLDTNGGLGLNLDDFRAFGTVNYQFSTSLDAGSERDDTTQATIFFDLRDTDNPIIRIE